MNIYLWAIIGKIFSVICTIYFLLKVIFWVMTVDDSMNKTTRNENSLNEFKYKWLSDVQYRLKKLEDKIFKEKKP